VTGRLAPTPLSHDPRFRVRCTRAPLLPRLARDRHLLYLFQRLLQSLHLLARGALPRLGLPYAHLVLAGIAHRPHPLPRPLQVIAQGLLPPERLPATPARITRPAPPDVPPGSPTGCDDSPPRIPSATDTQDDIHSAALLPALSSPPSL